MKKILSLIFIIIFSAIIGLAYTTSTNLSLKIMEDTDDTYTYTSCINGNFNIVDALFNNVSTTEFGYLDGVTSAIQTQINAITPITYTAGTGLTLTGTVFSSKDSEIVHDSLSGFVANEHIDWTTDQGATNIHSGNYTDTNTTYTGDTEIVITGTVLSIGSAMTRDTELSSYYLKTAIDTQGEMETIWGVDLANAGDLHAAATVTTTNGLSISGQEVSLQAASTNTHGALIDTDWNTFNSKAASGANTDITSIYNTSLKFGRDADNLIDFTTDNKIIFRFNGADKIEMISTGELDMNAGSVGFTQQTATGNTNTTIDWRLGNKFYFTFGAMNETITFTHPTNPCNLVLVMKQDATGSRTATWDADVFFPGGTHPTLTTGANLIDIICFYYDGTNFFGMAGLDFK